MKEIQKELYSQNPEWFLSYIEQTNQKQILIENIKKKLETLPIQEGSDFVFTDVGAGDGVITLPIIKYLKDERKAQLTTNVIEYSDKLVSVFQKKLQENNLSENVNIYNKRLEDTDVPESDFTLVVHVFLYLDDILTELQKIVSSLKRSGTILIVETNLSSDDVRIRKGLGLKLLLNRGDDFNERILNQLKNEDVTYTREIVESSINFSEVFNLTPIGKNIISFFYHKSFEVLSDSEIKHFLSIAKQFVDANQSLTKREDYVWVIKQ